MANSITADEIREQFSQAMSAMYQQEVPQYGTLLELVADVNLAVLENNPQLHEKMVNADELARLNVERHGAIRVGTAQELATLRRMFAIMGMYPVSYYDLSQAGVPVHSTAFRPLMMLLWRVIPSAFLPPYSALSLSRTNFAPESGGDSASARYLHPTLSTTVRGI
ncbi:putative cytoplasmic protein [Escherichia coli]|nr:putative cytoplasmic protein [Escherichia coli]